MNITDRGVEAIDDFISSQDIGGTPNPVVVEPIPNPIVEPIVEDTVKIADLNPGDFGGDRFDSSGNLIKDNKIFKSREAIEAEHKAKNVKPTDVKPTDVKVEDTEEYVLDKDGNLANKKGEIVKQKGEFEVDKDGNVIFKEESFINSLIEVAKNQGYEFVDETGKPLEFEDSQEGYFEVAKYIGEQEAIAYVTQVHQQYPEIKNLQDHLLAGGSPLDFYKSRVELRDYTNVDLKDNVGNQELALLDKYTKIHNMDENEARKFIDLIKSAGNLEVDSKAALVELQNWQKSQIDKYTAENQAKIVAAKEAQIQTLTAIEQTVLKGELDNITIPANKRREFFEYLTKEIEPGVTKSAKDYDSLPLDKKLVFEYLLFSGLNVDELVKIRVAKAQADLIKDRNKNTRAIKITNNHNFQANGALPQKLEDMV
jgi:hypothetical protein